MTPIREFIRNTLEKWLGTFYEGPDAPSRLRSLTLTFANGNPHATRKEWSGFATSLAEEAYRAAYIRGFEQRQLPSQKDMTPEQIADILDPNWRWIPHTAVDLVHPENMVTDEYSLDRVSANPPDAFFDAPYVQPWDRDTPAREPKDGDD